MKMKSGIVVFMVALGGTAFAESPRTTASVDSLKGRFGFNWLNSPSKEKCVRIDDKLLKEFQKNYQCDLQENSNSSSGKPNVLCSRKDETKQYMIFKTKTLCEEEREAQMANAGD